jgi:hypothetical protein
MSVIMASGRRRASIADPDGRKVAVSERARDATVIQRCEIDRADFAGRSSVDAGEIRQGKRLSTAETQRVIRSNAAALCPTQIALSERA